MVPSAIDAAMAISLVVVSATPRATNRVRAARSTRALVSSALPMAPPACASAVRRWDALAGELGQPIAALARPQPDAEQAQQESGRYVDEMVLVGSHHRDHH